MNLITGKNNTRKSTILEAIELYATFGRFDVLLKQLKQQGLFNQKEESDTERNLQALKSLFYNYNADFDIKIGSISHHLNIELIYYREEIIKKEDGFNHSE